MSIFFLIWALKLLTILAVPYVYGPLHLYRVSELQPVSIENTDLIVTETAIQSARVMKSIPRAELKQVTKTKEGNYVFTGIGAPSMTLVMLLSDAQTAVYYADIDKAGKWSIEHTQKDFALQPGNHSVVVFNFDKKNAIRSDASDMQYFKVRQSWIDGVIQNSDRLANWSAIVVLVMGVLLTVLTV